MNSALSLQLNQFDFDENQLINAVEESQGEFLQRTVSLCSSCHQHIPAYVYHRNNSVWIAKKCKLHGLSHHMIERDYKFYAGLEYKKDSFNFTTNTVMTEVTDRCNIDCPHCYHIPNNKIPDIEYGKIIDRIYGWYDKSIETSILLAGAEPLVRKDIANLIQAIDKEFPASNIATLTNGINLSDYKKVQRLNDAGLKGVLIGLNHPDYLNMPKIRKKQLEGIENCINEGLHLYYIGYTMSSITELHDILYEITNNPWYPAHFRIRYGSDIGRYPDQQRLFVSDTYKIIEKWCLDNNKTFNIISQADNNLYHVMVEVEGKPIRVIQWCDETDIHMEELRSGPYCDFVENHGITNFLHQIIRRDVQKNQKNKLLDYTPNRYLMENQKDATDLDFKNLK